MIFVVHKIFIDEVMNAAVGALLRYNTNIFLHG